MKNRLMNTAVYAAPERPGAADEVPGVVTVEHADGGDGRAHALSLAAKLHANKAFEETLEHLVDAGEEVKQGPLTMMFALEDVFGENLEGIAEPGTEDGNNPEKYKVWVIVDGERKQRNGNFFTDLFNGTLMGERINARLAQVKEALKSNADMAKITMKDIRDKIDDKRWLTAEGKKLGARLAAGRGLVRKAAQVKFAITRITELAGVGVDYATYKDEAGREQLLRTQYPFVVYDETKRGQETHCSVSQLLALGTRENIAAVTMKGGSYSVLVGTLRRDTSKDKTKETAVSIDIQSIDNLHDYMAGVATFLDYVTPEGRKHKAALVDLMKGKQGDELVLIFGKLYLSMDSIWATISNRYEKLADELAKVAGEDEAKAA